MLGGRLHIGHSDCTYYSPLSEELCMILSSFIVSKQFFPGLELLGKSAF